MRRFAAIMVMVLASGVAPAEEPVRSIASDSRIEDALAAWAVWVENDLGESGVPAASYSFVYRDELLASGGIGFADPETGSKADADTLYSICSISKLFTSIAVMQLRDAGKLDLDESIGDSVPWFASLTDAHPGDEPISIRRVLTHSAGLPRESDSPYWAPDFDFPTTEQIRERLPSQQTLYPSGRYFQYSNLGMALLGEVVASRSGRPWAEVVLEDILAPLGMENTFTSVPDAHATGRLAAGFSARRGSPDRERLTLFDVEGIGPAAGMASSANDLAAFARWQLRLRAEDGDQVLKSSTLREMQRVHWVDPDWKTTWGLGFSVVNRDDMTWARHGGGCPGYYTEFAVLPKEELGIVVLTNAIGSNHALYARKAAAVLAPAVKAASKGTEDSPERDTELDRYVGVYDTVWGREGVVRWKDGLAAVWLSSRAIDPEEWIAPLKHVEGHVFRRVRTDDKSLGEEWLFEVDEDGQVVSVTVHSNPAVRVR
ncbi:MAG: serine hydrolase [Acidobacteria bacterium]|nr:serine hydrolase [Candidatus Sulfomarinibacter kjeldsenii]